MAEPLPSCLPLRDAAPRRRRRIAVLLAAFAGLVLAAATATAQPRRLHWAALEVEARLDAAGRLHVVERQEMVFTGDWNGGERTFRLSPGQRLELERLRRLDSASGTPVELVEGDLHLVDHFEWFEGDTLRWRSRLPSDPPFEDETLTYELHYELSGVVQDAGGRYRLDHDFAFPDRAGSIRRFRLDLALDPAWRSPEGQTVHLERRELRPGQSAVLTLDLDYAGEGRPAAVAHQVPRPPRLALAAAAFAALALLGLLFSRHEAGQGRFEAPDLPAALDEAWLEEHLLALLPEEAGALWDQKIGPPEVAAVIARLAAEGKLSTRVEEGSGWRSRPVLHLELRVERDGLAGYERKLVDKLFFAGRTATDTEAIRQHYKAKGFSPATVIRPELEKRLEHRPGFGKRIASPSWKPTAALLGAFAACLLVELLTRGAGAGSVLVVLLFLTTVPASIAYALAKLYRLRADRLGVYATLFLVPSVVMVVAVALVVVRGARWFLDPTVVEPGVFGLLAMLLLPVALVNSILNVARTRDGREAVAARRRLAAVRRHFARELERAAPALRDEWTPYLLAFGLQRKIDRWYRGFGGEGVPTDTLRAVTGTRLHGGTGGSGAGWTGGGGTFGGAGATAAWSAAATGLAAGVSPPGSSGGGSGGGGGSSGGGGGGGW